MASSSGVEARLRFEPATPEELALALTYLPRLRSLGILEGAVFAFRPVKRGRAAARTPDSGHGITTPPFHGAEAWGREDYVLRRGLKGWLLVLAGAETVVPDMKGVKCAEFLLMNPPLEPLHASELAEKACCGLVIEGQRNLGIDDGETFAGKNKARRECLAVIDDSGSSEAEKKEAQTELDGIDAWARKHLRGTEAGEQRQVRAVRQTMRRLLNSLAKATDRLGQPDLVQRSFGEHLDRYLWQPSCRGGRRRQSRLRAGFG